MADPTPQSVQLQAWLDRMRDGDEAARGELLNCACDRLRLLAHKMLKSYPRVRRWEETDDVLQNASLRMHRTFQQLTVPTVRDFFRLAALNIRRELLDLAKHYYGPQGLGARHATDGGGDAPTNDALPQQSPPELSNEPSRLAAWTEFHRQIDLLDSDEREVFDLLWYQGLSQAEAADLLKISERTIKRRWQSARLKLHEALQGEMPE